MAKIIRTKPNFLPRINGVAFVPHERGSISEDVAQEVVDGFLVHDGYELDEAPAKPAKGGSKGAKTTKAATKPEPEKAPAAPAPAEPPPAAPEDGPSF